jgi:hypothetical protein
MASMLMERPEALYSNKLIRRYTEGDCWALALELSRVSGGKWDVAVTSGADHAFALSEDGEWAFDINGKQPLSALLDKWHSTEDILRFYSVRVAKEYFDEEMWADSFPPVSWAQARRIAREIFNLYSD